MYQKHILEIQNEQKEPMLTGEILEQQKQSVYLVIILYFSK